MYEIEKHFLSKVNDFIPYLWPSRLLPQLVVVFLFLIFFIWVTKFIQKCLKIKSQRKEILQLENVEKLVPKYIRKSAEMDVETEKIYFKNIFLKIIKEKEISENSPIARHLKAIYIAGQNQGRLDSEPLINHTLHEIFSGAQALKGVLSTFIVIGLLGTLVGLADTFSSLNPSANSQTLGHLNQSVNYMLSSLLVNMKSAFAPSILGVLMTIISVLAYIYIYQHRLCSPLRADLERLTLTVWIPMLYPTTTEKIKDITQENLKVVRDVATFAGQMQKDVADFREKTGEAVTSIDQLSAAVMKIGDAATKIEGSLVNRIDIFSENVNRLTSFQAELTTLYKTLVEDSKAFREQVKHTLGEQNTWFPELIKSLKSYEVVHIKGQEELDRSLRKLISEGTSGFESLSNKNLESIELVRATLEGNLAVIHNELKTSLDEFGKHLNSFGRFSVPIEEAADRMSGTFQNLAKTLKDINSEFSMALVRAIQDQPSNENSEVKESFNKLESVMQGLIETLKNNGEILKETLLRESLRKKEKSANEPAIKYSPEKKPLPLRDVSAVNLAMQDPGISEDMKTLIRVSERQSRAIERYFSAEETRKQESILSLAKRLLKMNVWTL